MKIFTAAADKKSSFQYCLLAYSPSHGTEFPSADDRPVMLLLKTLSRLVVMIEPDWREFIMLADREYLDSVIADIRRRAELDPAALFQQATELNLGPLITQEAGCTDENHFRFAEILAHFLPIDEHLDNRIRPPH